jgi:acyl dehydratase
MDVERLLKLKVEPAEQTLHPRDCLLYALSIGLGNDPEAAVWRDYIYEGGLKVFPTMATVLCRPAGWMHWPELGVPLERMLHGAQRLTLQGPLVPSETVAAETRISDVVDKGPGRGALLILEKSLYAKGRGDLLATLEWTIFCRGAGGFGGPSQSAGGEMAPAPDRPADAVLALPIRPEAALLYRLNGDMNPIHADPEAARRAGFARPIVHGLCVYGAVAAEVARHRGIDPSTLARLDARFSSPLLVGEAVDVHLWEVAGGHALVAKARGRDAVVLDRGFIGFG